MNNRSEIEGAVLQWPLEGRSSADDVHGVVTWHRLRDRYQHRIGCAGQGSYVCLAEAVEGGDTDAWPCSPPIQQMVRQVVGECDVVLALGMAGRTHWSLSMEARSTELVVDIAAKLQSSPDSLGMTYLLHDSAPEFHEGRLVVVVPTSSVCLELVPDARTELDTYHDADGQLLVRFSPRRIESTTRWGAAFRLRHCDRT